MINYYINCDWQLSSLVEKKIVHISTKLEEAQWQQR